MRRRVGFVSLAPAFASCFAWTSHAAPSERVTLDIAFGSAVVAHAQTYEALSRNQSGGQIATRVEPNYLSSAATINLASTYRVHPKWAFGLDGFAEFELRTPSNEWLDAAGLRFGHRTIYALSAVAEVNFQARGFEVRHGWFIRSGVGAHWIDDALQRSPSVLEVHRAKDGRQLLGIYGYRWAMVARASFTLQLMTMLQTTGVQVGLSVGGGFQ
jgi:hypothetical protein